MGNIFDIDNQKDSTGETSKTISSEAEAEPTAENVPSNARQGGKAVGIVLVLAVVVILGLLLTLGAIGVHFFRSLRNSTSLGNPTSPEAPAKEAKTKLETFQGKAGIVLVKSYSDLGSVSGTTGGSVEIAAMELQDRSNGTKASGLLVSVKPSGQYSQQSRSFIDHDEIESLLKGIDYINGVTAATPPLKNFEAHYRTRGDFSIVTYNKGDGTIGVAVTGNSIGSNDVFLNTPDLGTVKNYVISAKELLDKIVNSKQ